MDSTKSDDTSADDAKIKDDLFNLVEKLRIELQEKDQQLQVKDKKLAKEKRKNKVCTFLLFTNFRT
jgi:ATP-dependent protease HslVU (ClpYQ) peptidase subunit